MAHSPDLPSQALRGVAVLRLPCCVPCITFIGPSFTSPLWASVGGRRCPFFQWSEP